MVERWRQRKASRKSEEIEEEYSRGLVAVLEGHEDEALRHFRAVLERARWEITGLTFFGGKTQIFKVTLLVEVMAGIL